MSFSGSLIHLFQRFTANVRVIELYWLNLLLIILLTTCLWSLPQSADILVKAAEAGHFSGRLYVMAGLFFYVFIIWYSSRAVSWKSRLKTGSSSSAWMLLHLPRIMGFYVYSIFILSYLNTLLFLNKGISFWLLIISLLTYFFIYLLLEMILKWKGEITGRRLLFYKLIFLLSLALIFVCSLIPSRWGFLVFAVLSQFLFIFLTVNRDEVFKVLPGISLPKFPAAIIRRAKIPEKEYLLFLVFNGVAAIAVLVYLLSVFSLPFAINAGALTIVLCSLTVIGGAANLIRTLSLSYRINFGLILVIALFIFGFATEPHKAFLRSAENTGSVSFDKRQNFTEYLTNWLDRHAGEFKEDSIVPMIFVHADGGASRSGYWVASVLGKVEDEVGPAFSDHLFCLSGASGGSVGNATFFSLLYLRDHQQRPHPAMFHMTEKAQQFLRTDFLSYPLARALGPGAVINCIYPLIPDRARALEYSLEQGAGQRSALNGFFSTGFSNLIALRSDSNYRLPILCLNVTRMQDAHPALLSNVIIDRSVSVARLDILNQIEKGQDIPLSTATILGARFPYLTPAGLITEKLPQKGKPGNFVNQHHYYVDGGYFDNSGAGVIQEMMQRIELLKKEAKSSARFQKYDLNKLRYVVIHITNTPPGNDTLKKIHPFKNDLLAPLVTLAGSYASQTTASNSRLEDYFFTISKGYKTNGTKGLNDYFDINLYTRDYRESYPMNWVISDTLLHQMNRRLKRQDRLKELISNLKHFSIKGKR